MAVLGSIQDPWFAEARDWRATDPNAVLKIGIDKSELDKAAGRGLSWKIGQLYGVLGTGLIGAEHVFQGAKRPMLVDGDSEADEKALFFTWRAQRDAQMTGSLGNHQLTYFDPPDSSVFCVMVMPVTNDRHPGIFGWARRWHWLEADTGLLGAPNGWNDKYIGRIAYGDVS